MHADSLSCVKHTWHLLSHSLIYDLSPCCDVTMLRLCRRGQEPECSLCCVGVRGSGPALASPLPPPGAVQVHLLQSARKSQSERMWTLITQHHRGIFSSTFNDVPQNWNYNVYDILWRCHDVMCHSSLLRLTSDTGLLWPAGRWRDRPVAK